MNQKTFKRDPQRFPNQKNKQTPWITLFDGFRRPAKNLKTVNNKEGGKLLCAHLPAGAEQKKENLVPFTFLFLYIYLVFWK